jgi:hypothetical protein
MAGFLVAAHHVPTTMKKRLRSDGGQIAATRCGPRAGGNGKRSVKEEFNGRALQK